MALHLTRQDGTPITVEFSDLLAIRHALEGTVLLLHGGEAVQIRENDEEIHALIRHALIRIEYGQHQAMDAAPTQ